MLVNAFTFQRRKTYLIPVKPTPISCAYAGACRALAISWAYVPEVADLLLATLILGFCGALPCPMKVACGAVRRRR